MTSHLLEVSLHSVFVPQSGGCPRPMFSSQQPEQSYEGQVDFTAGTTCDGDGSLSRDEIRDMMNLTILVSEQVLSFALDVADRFLVIENGRLVHEDRRADVNEARISAYLSV